MFVVCCRDRLLVEIKSARKDVRCLPITETKAEALMRAEDLKMEEKARKVLWAKRLLKVLVLRQELMRIGNRAC